MLQGLEIPKLGTHRLTKHSLLSYISNDRITFTSVITSCENKWMPFKLIDAFLSAAVVEDNAY